MELETNGTSTVKCGAFALPHSARFYTTRECHSIVHVLLPLAFHSRCVSCAVHGAVYGLSLLGFTAARYTICALS